MYYFGLYHWHERSRSLLLALCGLALAAVLRRSSVRGARLLGLFVALGSVGRASRPLSKLLRPAPWALERYKYDALATELPLEGTTRLLDVGCGTGRSLVAFAPYLSESRSAVGLDVFDDRVILGNAPALARRNAREAGIDVTPVRGDAARLPLAEDSRDVVTACRVLHDLPAEDHDRTLREIRRICDPDGVLGVLELPIVPDGVESDPETYWCDRIVEAGFSVATVKRVERRRGGEPYVVIVATPLERLDR